MRLRTATTAGPLPRPVEPEGRGLPGVSLPALPEGGFQQVQRHPEGAPKLAVAAVARLL